MDYLVPTQKLAKFGPKMGEKMPFLAQKCRFEVILKLLRPLGGLGGSNGSKIARGHCIMYKKGARQLSSGSADLTDFKL